MGFILRFIAIFSITIKRMYTQRGLVLANCLGVISAVALTMSIPIYSDAVYQNILDRQITPQNQTAENAAAARPSFAFLYRYIGSWAGPMDWGRVKPADDYFSHQIPGEMGLRPKLFVRYLKTDQLMLFGSGKADYKVNGLPLDFLYMATLTDQEKHITLTEGNLPKTAVPGAADPVEVLMREDRANQLGVQAGEQYILLKVVGEGTEKHRVEIPVKISGIWKQTDPTENYWFYSGSEFSQVLLVPEDTLLKAVIPQIKNELDSGLWYWIMDSSSMQSGQVPGLLNRIEATRRKGTILLPKIRLDISPEDALYEYQRASQSLAIFLYAFSIPLLVMILIFLSLVMNMVVGQRRNEIAVLRSRGSTVSQLGGMAVLESLLLVVIGLVFGSPLAMWIAQVLGRVRSFLDFSSSSAVLHTHITFGSLQFGAVAGLIAVFALMLPTLDAAHNTIVNYKRDQARAIRSVWWKRAYIDLLLLIPSGYGIYLLRQGGMGLPNDPFQNPLLLLIPALAIFAFSLVTLRLLPIIMKMIAWLASFTKSVGILMAARSLARTSSGYTAPLLLLAMTLSLSTFTATMAQTMDHHTYDSNYYAVGSDISISLVKDLGQTIVADQSSTQSSIFFSIPVTDHLLIPGVKAAARVARTTVQLSMGGTTSTINYIGIDRTDFPRVAFWRSDFAPQSLGEIMNMLGAKPEGLLVSRDLLASKGLAVGDGLFIGAYEKGQGAQVPYQIVGVLDYFPTWYPTEGPLIVGNLDYLYDQVGAEFPFDVWLKASPGANYGEIITAEENLYRSVLHTKIAPSSISTEQFKPERQGFFGLLSVGFSALAIMSVVGFLLYALFSFRQRFIELGMLRAIGLSTSQMLGLLAAELAFLFLTGLAAGTGFGIWISNLFIPYLQVGSNLMTSHIPPFLVQINWLAVYQIYALFALLFVVALVILTVLLMRMKIFQAIKLGEVV